MKRVILITCILITGCTHYVNKKEHQVKFVNEFPSIMTVFENSNGGLNYLVEISPESIIFNCRLRSDSPYYWCDITADLLNPDPKLPSKIEATFKTVVDSSAKKKSEKLINLFNKNNKKITLIYDFEPFITDESKSIYGSVLGLFTQNWCLNLFDDYTKCPTRAKKYYIW